MHRCNQPRTDSDAVKRPEHATATAPMTRNVTLKKFKFFGTDGSLFTLLH